MGLFVCVFFGHGDRKKNSICEDIQNRGISNNELERCVKQICGCQFGVYIAGDVRVCIGDNYVKEINE